MKKLFFVFLFLSMFAVPTFAAAPVCLFQDILSGPASGGEGGNGMYMTITGKNFGSNGTVTINGTAVAQTFNWGAADVTGNYQTVGLQVASGTTSGSIVVTTPGGSCSNLTFTVRSGNIWFIGPAVDTSTPQSCSTMKAANSYSTPWGMTNVAQTDSQSIYTPTTQRTPFTYYNCMTAGDTLVFLNGASFRYNDGAGLHTSLGPNKAVGTSRDPLTFMARPGATAQLGGTGNIEFGFRVYNEPYAVISGLSTTGSGVSGEGIGGESGHLRIVGNTVTCPDCSGAAGAISFGYDVSVLGNAITNVSTKLGTPANKEYHAAYGGAGAGENYNYDFEYNRIWNTEAYNGIQFNNGSINLYNITLASNDIADVYGACINLASIDPSLGYVNVYNNVLHHCGVGLSNDEGFGEGYHSCISFPEDGAAVGGPGTASVYNNTMFDCSSYLNTYEYTTPITSCAITVAATLPNITVNLMNNAVYQPAYSQTGSQNVYLCGSGTSELKGGKNVFYSGSTPRSTSPASNLTSLAVPTNPVFVKSADGPTTNYQLQSTSLAIGAGSASLRPMLDFNGAMRPTPPAIGAFEYDSTSSSEQITVTATPNPATIEEPVTLTATVAQTGSSTPTGTVNFLNGSTSLGQASLSGEGTAVVVVSTLTAGAYEVVASYSGDANYPAGESGEFSLDVQSATTTSLVASPNSVAAGQTLVLTATVDGNGDSFPSGTVHFLNGSTLLGTGTLNSSGVTTMSTSALAAGTYNLTAQYAGSGSFLSSTSSAVSVKVTAAAQSATTTSLAATPNPVVYGHALALTATVKGNGQAIPTGTVHFMSGSTLLGSGTLSSTGVATLSTSSLAVGTYSLTAQYVECASFLASTSTAVSVKVVAAGAQAATTTKLTASPSPVMPGAVLTLSATVRGTNGAAVSGTVSFTSGSIQIGTATLNPSGSATLNTTSLTAGTYEVTAKYAGNGTYAASSSAAVTVTVKAQTTTTSLVVSPTQATPNEVVTLTATVKGTTIVPGGIVNFVNGSTLLGTGSLNSSGVATLSVKSLAIGTYRLTAECMGNGSSLASASSAVSVTVQTQTTTTGVAASAKTVTTGQALTLTATVKGGDKALPTGSVRFMNGSALLGTETLNSSGVATLSTTSLAAGAYSLAADYEGNANSQSSKSGVVTVTVTAKSAPTSTVLAATPSAVTKGQVLVLSATVQANGATKLAGNVTFLNGSTVLGMADLDSSGLAKLPSTSLAVGKYRLTAKYSGNSSFLSSASLAVSVVVKAEATTTSLAVSSGTLSAGETLALTATVKGSNPLSPAGTITFLNGSTSLGTATLNSSGVAKLSTASLTVGTHSLTAQFAGDADSLTSKSAGIAVTVTAKAQATTTILAATTSDVTVGDALGLTATVRTDGATKPTGSVTFMKGSTVLGTATLNSSGVAKLSSTSLPIGENDLTVRFPGSSRFLASTSPEVSVTVKAETPAIVRGFLLNAPASAQSETRQTSGTTLCKLPVPAYGSQAGATVTYLGEGGSCGPEPASR